MSCIEDLSKECERCGRCIEKLDFPIACAGDNRHTRPPELDGLFKESEERKPKECPICKTISGLEKVHYQSTDCTKWRCILCGWRQ